MPSWLEITRLTKVIFDRIATPTVHLIMFAVPFYTAYQEYDPNNPDANKAADLSLSTVSVVASALSAFACIYETWLHTRDSAQRDVITALSGIDISNNLTPDNVFVLFDDAVKQYQDLLREIATFHEKLSPRIEAKELQEMQEKLRKLFDKLSIEYERVRQHLVDVRVKQSSKMAIVQNADLGLQCLSFLTSTASLLNEILMAKGNFTMISVKAINVISPLKTLIDALFDYFNYKEKVPASSNQSTEDTLLIKIADSIKRIDNNNIDALKIRVEEITRLIQVERSRPSLASSSIEVEIETDVAADTAQLISPSTSSSNSKEGVFNEGFFDEPSTSGHEKATLKESDSNPKPKIRRNTI